MERSASKLAALGAAKGDRVAILMLNSPEYLELYFSTAIAGAAIVPLNTRWHVNEIIYALTDSGSKILFVDERFAPLVPRIRQAVPEIEHFIYAQDGACPPAGAVFRHSETAGLAALCDAKALRTVSGSRQRRRTWRIRTVDGVFSN